MKSRPGKRSKKTTTTRSNSSADLSISIKLVRNYQNATAVFGSSQETGYVQKLGKYTNPTVIKHAESHA